jgi:alpha-L-rhamnosidase
MIASTFWKNTMPLCTGQTEDRRRFDPAVLLPAFDTGTWDPVVVATAPEAALVGYDAAPVRRVAELVPTSITEPRPGVYVVDFGQNINGWTRLSNLGPCGTEVTLTHGESLDDGGDVTIDHLRVDFPFLPEPLPAGQIDTVVSSGLADDVFEPRLTTHGFRYVRIEGHPDPLEADDVRGVVVHSDLRRTGWFECDDERVNRLHEAAVWSLRDNICEIPTDCPHRERAGWTGDWQIFAPTAAFLYDVESFSRKWLADVRLAQRDDGLIANHAPSTPAEGFAGATAALHGSVGWGDAIVLVPWGSTRRTAIRCHSPSVGRRWSAGWGTAPAARKKAGPHPALQPARIRRRTSATCGTPGSTGVSGWSLDSRSPTSAPSSPPTSRRSPPLTSTGRPS